MFEKLFPQNTSFFEFFEEHAELTHQAAASFLQLMSFDQKEIEINSNPIKILEHKADVVTHRCIEELHKSFITPFQADDIFHLISRMDDIIDCVDAAFEACLIYKITKPTTYIKPLAQLLSLATEKTQVIIKGLRFVKKQAPMLRDICMEINKIENEGDNVFRKALSQLFDEEKDIRLIIKWKEVYEILEQAIDYCEDVANIVEGIMLEYN